ncbi:SDR family oxidoreductase [Pelagibius sp. Alg239-R121]|uniref:SDR family NAD(P)-dependent oxidoreductase n=1 Tax=Pelagibius sp. Alg239-R121 TaxID=2993448 RepID=UPI0024A757B4|nr:SDR family NAD(P)-dependent oxidoreductase [Pelagibius sp. Alg239-R121]
MYQRVIEPLRPSHHAGLKNRAAGAGTVGSRLHSRQWAGKRVVITGGTDGIGRHLAKKLAMRGADVLIVGRRAETEVEPLLTPRQSYVRADLSHADGPTQVTEALTRIGWQQVNMLVHNAAVGWIGPSEQQSADSVDELLVTNLLSPVALTSLLLPHLRWARGKIVFIGSVAAGVPCPSFAVYGATKSALTGFARSLRLELAGEVGVQIIHPGPTRTGFHAKSGVRSHGLARLFMDPEGVAERVLRAMQSNRAVSTLGYKALLGEWVRHAGGLM